mgnify:CR=1 FL=1
MSIDAFGADLDNFSFHKTTPETEENTFFSYDNIAFTSLEDAAYYNQIFYENKDFFERIIKEKYHNDYNCFYAYNGKKFSFLKDAVYYNQIFYENKDFFEKIIKEKNHSNYNCFYAYNGRTFTSLEEATNYNQHLCNVKESHNKKVRVMKKDTETHRWYKTKC